MAYVVMAHIVMANIVMVTVVLVVRLWRGLTLSMSYGPYSYGLYMYGLYSYGLHSYGPYSYGPYSYGPYSDGRRLETLDASGMAGAAHPCILVIMLVIGHNNMWIAAAWSLKHICHYDRFRFGAYFLGSGHIFRFGTHFFRFGAYL